MWNLLGSICLLGGVAGVLYSWICEQREKQKRLEALLLFLRKSIYAMKTEKVKVIPFFEKYNSIPILSYTLQKIAKRLSVNNYPNGQMVWEEVFREEEQNWGFDSEVFHIILQAGNGFFCRSREENIVFLEKSLKDLEEQKVILQKKDVQERKIWVPVGMLGSVMIVILFL